MTIEKPAEGAVATTSADAVVGGVVEAPNDGTVDCVLLTLTRVDQNNQPQEVDRQLTNVPDGPTEHPLNWLPKLPYNDTYTTVGQAVGRGFGRAFTGAPATRQFRTEIPPVRVSGLKIVTDNEKRAATLTWNRNPEADVVGYVVRRIAADPKFSGEATVTEPTHTDDLAAVPPGSYRYHVLAVRRRTQNPQDTSGIPSATPAEGSVTIAGPPTATSTSTPPTTRRTATTARPRNRPAPNRVDLRRFGPTSTLPESLEPEEGAFGDLDFGERQRGRTDMTITEQGAPVIEDGDDRPTSLLFLAAGLLAFVVLLHLRWLKKEVDRAPLEEVPPEA